MFLRLKRDVYLGCVMFSLKKNILISICLVHLGKHFSLFAFAAYSTT